VAKQSLNMACLYALDDETARKEQERADLEMAQELFIEELVIDDIRKEHQNSNQNDHLDHKKVCVIPVKPKSHAWMCTLDILHKFVLNVIQKEGRLFKKQGSEELITWSVFHQLNSELASETKPIGLSSWKEIRTEIGRNNGSYDEENIHKMVLVNYNIRNLIFNVDRLNIELDDTLSIEEKNKARYELSQWYGVSLFMEDYQVDEITEDLRRELDVFETTRIACFTLISTILRFLRCLRALGGIYDPETKWTPNKQYKVVCTTAQEKELKERLQTAEDMIEMAPKSFY
jgi:hypothetical protein